MLSSCIRTVAPAIEPVTVAQAQAQSRIITDADDALLTLYLQAAREYCEAQTNRALLQQTWRASFSHFPRWRRPSIAHEGYGAWAGLGYGSGFGWGGWGYQAPLLLPRAPLLGIVSIAYTDASGSPQTLDPSQYVVNLDAAPAELTPGYGTFWPATLPNTPNAVQVTYNAGYGDTAAAVPADLQLAILMLVAHWYENREASVMPLTGTGPVEIPLGVQALLSQYSVPVFTYEDA